MKTTGVAESLPQVLLLQKRAKMEPDATPRTAGLVGDDLRGGGRVAAVAGEAGATGLGRSTGRAERRRGHWGGATAAGRRIRAGAPAGRRGERRRSWARHARALGRRCRSARSQGLGGRQAARRGRGAGAAKCEGGGGYGPQARGQSAGIG
ncbi:putative beta-glucosidase 15 [Miscanthus floridulus]|uniref:putative beta-glucosidase 15 n=1 Tax=Miscanthus floridulus TaxID=154761 RepID=UPI00345A5329